MMARWQLQTQLMVNYSITQLLNKKTSFTKIGRHSGDKKAIEITADMTSHIP